jgi:hypothetical protein
MSMTSPTRQEAQRPSGRLISHNSVWEVILLFNTFSMAQSRDITLPSLGNSIQIAINNGPIHLSLGTSVMAKPDDYANGSLPVRTT